MSLHNAVQCQLVVDRCRRTFNYKTVGQNTYSICEKKRHVPIRAAVEEALSTWFNEHKNITSMDVVQHFGNPADRPIKHFTQMVKSKADRIGCSIIRFARKNTMLFNGQRKCTMIGVGRNVFSSNLYFIDLIIIRIFCALSVQLQCRKFKRFANFPYRQTSKKMPNR